jgi:tRNA modification GTPase
VRLSGQGCFDIAARVIDDFRADPPRTARLAPFRSADGNVIDQGLYLTFPAPASYTGEDLVELTCHGGLLVPVQLVSALNAAGARPAAPGEFTRRAVLNGKMDLLQAEAVGDLIDATAPAQARSALGQLEGWLSRRLNQLRAALIDLQALLGYDIDFPEEDDGPVSPARISAALDDARRQVEQLLATAPVGERIREGALLVLAGRPNAGKSSLFNALLGNERALVTELPGTTRDAIEAATSMNGWPVRLVDTAGLRSSDDRVERMGVEVSRRYLSAADLVLLCVEAGSGLTEEERELQESFPTLLVRTKSDLALSGDGDLAVSSVTGEGLEALRRRVAELAFAEGTIPTDLEPALTRERHRNALDRAATSLDQAAEHLGPGGDAVLVSHHVREATTALDELIGAVDIDQILDRIFASFCVGK